MNSIVKGLWIVCVMPMAAPVADAADVTTLVKQLKSPEADVRRNAARELANLGEEARPAVPALITAIKQDRDLFVRRFAVQALGTAKADPKVAVPVLKPLIKDNEKELAEAAITALGSMGPTAVAPLIDALNNKPKPLAKKEKGKKTPKVPDSSAHLRNKAAEALGQIGPEARAAVPALIQTLKDPEVRAAAITALGAMGPAAKEALPALQELTKAKGAKKDKALKQLTTTAIKKIRGQA